jgi:hypothetical protein
MVTNREQIRILKKAVATYLKILVIKYLEIVWETTTSNIAGNPAEIRTGYLLNTNLGRCSYTIPLEEK